MEKENDKTDYRPNRIRKTMTIKQRGVLNALAMFDCYMSASEMADDELRELIRNQLARYHAQPGINGRLSWGVTDAERSRSGSRAAPCRA